MARLYGVCVCVVKWVLCDLESSVILHLASPDGEESNHHCTISHEGRVRTLHPRGIGPPICAKSLGQSYYQGTLS